MARTASTDVSAAALARRHTEAAIEVLVLALEDPRSRMRAALALLDYGWGRAAARQPVAPRAMDQVSDTELDGMIAWLKARIAADRAAAAQAPAPSEASSQNSPINPLAREDAAPAARPNPVGEAPAPVGPSAENDAIRAATSCPARQDPVAARPPRPPVLRDWDRPLYANGRPWHAFGPAPARGPPQFP